MKIKVMAGITLWCDCLVVGLGCCFLLVVFLNRSAGVFCLCLYDPYHFKQGYVVCVCAQLCVRQGFILYADVKCGIKSQDVQQDAP